MSEIKVDTVAEKTSANGVTIDGLNIKDSKLVTANSVITSNITDANITTAKIADVNVTEGKIADNAITLAKMASGTDGNIISYDASGNPVAIATGNDGQVLTSTGAGSPPAFETLASAANTPMVRAVPSGNQSISSSTNTTVVFNTEIVDSDSAFASNTFTVPSGKAGQYFASATVISNPGVDNALLRVQFVRNINSSGADVNVCYGNYRTCSDQDETLTVFGIVDLAAADTLRLNYYSYQNGSTIKGNGEYVGGTSINIFKLI